MNRALTQMNCDRIARWYEPAEHLTFYKALESRRFAFLRQLRASRRAIICGGGDGRFLASLLLANPAIEVLYVDLSLEMMRIAQRRVAGLGLRCGRRVEFLCANVLEFIPPHRDYDLFATHFFLDCLTPEDAQELVLRMAQWAHPQARWVLSEFRHSQTPIGRYWTGAVIAGLYAAFHLATGLRANRIPRYRSFLRSAGFRLHKRDIATGGLLISELWEYREASECIPTQELPFARPIAFGELAPSEAPALGCD